MAGQTGEVDDKYLPHATLSNCNYLGIMKTFHNDKILDRCVHISIVSTRTYVFCTEVWRFLLFLSTVTPSSDLPHTGLRVFEPLVAFSIAKHNDVC